MFYMYHDDDDDDDDDNSLSTHKVFLIEVDEREWKWDVEWLVLVWVSSTLAWLKCNHQVNPASRPSRLEQWNELGTKDLFKKALKLAVNTCSCTHTGDMKMTRGTADYNPIKSNIFWRAQVVLFAHILTSLYIQIGRLPVPINSALKLKRTSWLDQYLSRRFLKVLKVSA